MSEPLFELLLQGIDADTDAYKLAKNISVLLDADPGYLEKQIVKVKYSNGRSEAIKMRLSQSKAERYQKVLTKLGLRVSVNAEMALVPIEKTVMKDQFTCPACGTEQEIAEGKTKVCKKCGIVKDKYDEVEKRKKLAEASDKLRKAEERRARVSSQKSMEEKNEEFLDKKYGNKTSKKTNVVALVSVFLGIAALGAGGYVYLNGTDAFLDKEEEAKSKIAKNTHVAKGSFANNIKNNGVNNKGNPVSTTSGSQGSIADNGSGEDVTEGLGNPYSQFADPSQPPISMKEGVKRMNAQLKKNNRHLPVVDKTALEDIATLYKESEENDEDSLDYSSIKKIAKTISNKGIRSEIVRQASWGEVETGEKAFDEYGIHPSPRKGEDDRSVQMAFNLMKRYTRDHKFNKAVEMISQISDPYLKSVAYNTIIDTQFYFDLKGAKVHRNRIEALSNKNSLTSSQKPLILGILSRADSLLDGKEAAENHLKNAQIAIKDIKESKEKIATLIQLSEDQREGLNLRYAHIFLQAASEFVEKEEMSNVNKERTYSKFVEQYARLFEFNQAKALVEKISDSDKQIALIQMIESIEKRASL